MSANSLAAPHQIVQAADERERFLVDLFDGLWTEYRRRVEYVQVYEAVVVAHGGRFFNDHIAFRTFAKQRPQLGVVTLARLFEALGYIAAGCYHFPDKHLGSIHYQHANPRLPKLFITELKTWELSAKGVALIDAAIAHHPPPLGDEVLHELANIDNVSAERRQALLADCLAMFDGPLWGPPEVEAVEELNKESQFAAWVLVHGYRVNHFTALVNSHAAASLDDIEKTVAALQAVGVPMKSTIEGAGGSKLRQTATEAVLVDASMTRGGTIQATPWTYAYFEVAERGTIVDPATGQASRFEGFLGPQATNLFELTRVK